MNYDSMPLPSLHAFKGHMTKFCEWDDQKKIVSNSLAIRAQCFHIGNKSGSCL